MEAEPDSRDVNVFMQRIPTPMTAEKVWSCLKPVMKKSVQSMAPGQIGQPALEVVEEDHGRR